MNPRPESALAEAVTSGEVTPVPADGTATPAGPNGEPQAPGSRRPSGSRRADRTSGANEGATRTDSPKRARFRPSNDPVLAALQPGALAKLRLQERAPRNLRRHLLRAVRRVAVLVLADLATFVVVRAMLRAVRDGGVLGETIAHTLRSLMPSGPLSGFQILVALLGGLLFAGNYGAGDARRNSRQLFIGVALAVAFPLWSRLWSQPVAGVIHYLLTVILLWLALVISRLLLDELIPEGFRTAKGAIRVLVVGLPEDARSVVRMPAFGEGTEYRMMGYVDAGENPAEDALGELDDVDTLVHDLHAEVVVVAGSLPANSFDRIAEAASAAHCQLLLSPRSDLPFVFQPSVVWKEGKAFIELTTPAATASALIIKRIVDSFASVLGLLLISPLFLLLALAVRIDSAGPVFYASERWGQGGRRIRIWKFRTMVTGAADLLKTDAKLREAFNREVKLRHDPRVTRVGGFLRRWSLDELPQLFNVVVGEMSLVGPRPKLPGEEVRYGSAFDAVISVPPGLTGLWQVSGRNDLSYEDRVALDLEYVRRCSLSLDFQILSRTAAAVLLGRGAH